MTKALAICFAIILTTTSATWADEADSTALCTDCGNFSFAALVTNALAVVSAISTKLMPSCEEIQISKTCTATYYGKGDGFSGGTTACGNQFKPTLEKTIAIKTVANGGFFSKSLCGKKAIVTTKDPRSGLEKSIEVRITDSGSMGGKTSKRCMDLSYRAAHELGIVQRGVASNTKIKVCK